MFESHIPKHKVGVLVAAGDRRQRGLRVLSPGAPGRDAGDDPDRAGRIFRSRRRARAVQAAREQSRQAHGARDRSGGAERHAAADPDRRRGPRPDDRIHGQARARAGLVHGARRRPRGQTPRRQEACAGQQVVRRHEQDARRVFGARGRVGLRRCRHGNGSGGVPEDQFRRPHALAYELGRRAFLDNPDCDAIYIGGGTWIAQPVAARLEEEFGKPAICNQTAQLWDILHLLKDWQPIKGHGRLLAAA